MKGEVGSVLCIWVFILLANIYVGVFHESTLLEAADTLVKKRDTPLPLLVL